MSYNGILKAILDSINNSNINITELQNNNNIIKTDTIITNNNSLNILYEYNYTNNKIVSISYDIILYSEENDEIGMYCGSIMLKNISNTIILPDFVKSKYLEAGLINTSISITVDETKIYINIYGINDIIIKWIGSIKLICL